MRRLIVAGADGMLGAEVMLRAEPECYGWPRAAMDIAELGEVADAFFGAGIVADDIVINCAGVREGDPIAMARANTVGPHVLAAMCAQAGAWLIHVSTDCVFDGQTPEPFCWRPRDPVRPASLYARTKAAGEPAGALVVRTSFVGPRHGLLRWALENKGGTVTGWHRAWWSGSTVAAVADGLLQIAAGPRHNGIEHLATMEPISKRRALSLINERYDLGLRIMNGGPAIDRSLAPTWVLPSLEEALAWVRP